MLKILLCIFIFSSVVHSANLPSGITVETATLSLARAYLEAASCGQYAFFIGGAYGNGSHAGGVYDNLTNIIDVYDGSAKTWSVLTMQYPRVFFGVTTIKDLLLIGGGWKSPYSDLSLVEMWNVTTKSWSTASLSRARAQLVATSTATKAFFGGGYGSYSFYLDVYDSSTKAWTYTYLSSGRSFMSAGALGNFVFFACGKNSSSQNVHFTDIFNANTLTGYTHDLVLKDYVWTQIATVGNYVQIYGTENAEQFDISTQTWTHHEFNGTQAGVATTVRNLTLFTGYGSTGYDLNFNEWYNVNLSKIDRGAYFATTTLGNIVLRGGGQNTTGFVNVVELFDFTYYTGPPKYTTTGGPSTSGTTTSGSTAGTSASGSTAGTSASGSTAGTSASGSTAGKTSGTGSTAGGSGSTTVTSGGGSTGSDANQTNSSSGNVGPIVGGVIGGFIALAAIAAVLLYFLKFRSGAKFSNEKMKNKDFKENPFYDDVT